MGESTHTKRPPECGLSPLRVDRSGAPLQDGLEPNKRLWPGGLCYSIKSYSNGTHSGSLSSHHPLAPRSLAQKLQTTPSHQANKSSVETGILNSTSIASPLVGKGEERVRPTIRESAG